MFYTVNIRFFEVPGGLQPCDLRLMAPLPELNFPYKTAGKLNIFIFLKVFLQKFILWRFAFYTVNIRVF